MTAQVSNENRPAIKPRKMDFEFRDIDKQFFYADNSIISTFLVALSATFPPGEKLFIDSVRHYRDQVTDPELQQQVRGFIGQEAHHSHQHKSINQALDRVGLYATRLEEDLEKNIEKYKGLRSPAQLLAATVSMEHITAIMAEFLLEHPQQLDPLPESFRDLLLWHAVEEIEHKAVAFDVFENCVKDKTSLRLSMLEQTLLFSWDIFRYQIKLLYWAKTFPTFKEFVGAGRFFFGKKGVIRGIFKPYLTYFKKGFHPWNHDNTSLIDEWRRTYEQQATPA